SICQHTISPRDWTSYSRPSDLPSILAWRVVGRARRGDPLHAPFPDPAVCARIDRRRLLGADGGHGDGGQVHGGEAEGHRQEGKGDRKDDGSGEQWERLGGCEDG